MTTDKEALIGMLGHAQPLWGDELHVRHDVAGRNAVTFHTGPDDAVATFYFNDQDQLELVQVSESGPA